MAFAMLAVVFACSPRAASTPEAVVTEIYATASAAIARGDVPYDYIPFSDPLAAAINEGSRLASERNEPFIEGDLATGCQDCQTFTDLVISVVSPPANGQALVRAAFATDGRPREMNFAMVQTPQGWRVDNITSPDGYDLRASVALYSSEAAPAAEGSCAAERGPQPAQLLVDQCIAVSPATHPPCNAANSCAMMEAEVARACGLLDAAQRPMFCPR
ncbi:hypothetical protein U91I_01363 [alpha proteobacterium U9-1i]|nr:hypothetical protein U91I_01363 [alpha proteobacterium U9-1i]